MVWRGALAKHRGVIGSQSTGLETTAVPLRGPSPGTAPTPAGTSPALVVDQLVALVRTEGVLDAGVQLGRREQDVVRDQTLGDGSGHGCDLTDPATWETVARSYRAGYGGS